MCLPAGPAVTKSLPPQLPFGFLGGLPKIPAFIRVSLRTTVAQTRAQAKCPAPLLVHNLPIASDGAGESRNTRRPSSSCATCGPSTRTAGRTRTGRWSSPPTTARGCTAGSTRRSPSPAASTTGSTPCGRPRTSQCRGGACRCGCSGRTTQAGRCR